MNVEKNRTMKPRMNTTKLALAALLAAAGSVALSATAQAATVLIDAATNNGSFELDAAGQPLTQPEKDDSQFWINGSTPSVLGTVDTFDQINVSDGVNVSEGTYSAAIGTAGNGTRNGIIGNTGHVVQSGDTFDFSFDWFAANNNWSATDEIEYFLFTTSDNTVNGTATTILSGTVSGVAGPDSAKQTESLSGVGTVAAANVGQDLWVVFNHNAATSSFARVDNVQLSVVPDSSAGNGTPIPTPASALMIPALVALIGLRRRRSA